jgi:hypothetical protein
MMVRFCIGTGPGWRSWGWWMTVIDPTSLIPTQVLSLCTASSWLPLTPMLTSPNRVNTCVRANNAHTKISALRHKHHHFPSYYYQGSADMHIYLAMKPLGQEKSENSSEYGVLINSYYVTDSTQNIVVLYRYSALNLYFYLRVAWKTDGWMKISHRTSTNTSDSEHFIGLCTGLYFPPPSIPWYIVHIRLTLLHLASPRYQVHAIPDLVRASH